jgi:lysophospholipase L1-like esterase
LIADFDLDEQLEALTTREISADLEVGSGANIEIAGQRNGGEFVRIDYIQFIALGGGSPALPQISSFSPTSGEAGSTVTISGQNFLGATSVTFDGAEAVFNVSSATQVTATVPGGATSGRIRITTPAGQSTSAGDFTVLVDGESVLLEAEGMSLSGYVVEVREQGSEFSGDNIKLSGTSGTASASFTGATGQYRILMRVVDEGDGQSNIELRIGGVLIADFNLDEQLEALTTREMSSGLQVENGAAIQIAGQRDGGEFARVDYLEFVALGPAVDPEPNITSFSPVNGGSGTGVTISGTGFTGATAITFNGVSASFTVVSDFAISTTVPAGATSGKIAVVTPEGSDESTGNFIVGSLDQITTLIFTPKDDAYLNVPQPGENHGSETSIRARLDKYEAYLKFDVSGLSDNVIAAKLKMIVNDGSADGGSIYLVSNNYAGSAGPWLEEGIDGTNAPVVSGSPIVVMGAVSQDDTVEFDLSPVVTSDGIYSFAMRNGLAADEVRYSAKEGRFAPQLIVQMEGESPLSPIITSVSPSTGQAGTEVTISGSNLAVLSSSSEFAGTIEIMPLGDSITKGVHGSTDNAGYRNDLAELLDTQSVDYDFVGGENDGSGFDTDHEGHGGWRADEILAEINGWLNSHRPNIVLLHIGTNDISSDETPQNVRDEISAIIDAIYNFDPAIATILASVVPRADEKDATNDALVALLDDVVTDKVLNGVDVRYAPINEEFISNPSYAFDFLADDVHPNDIGYAIMANVFFDVIKSLIFESYDLEVAFNGLSASDVSIDSEDQIRAVAPSGVISGPVTVATTYGLAESPTDFLVVPGGAGVALSVSFPRGGMILSENSTHTIRWQSSGYIDNVNIEYSPDNGGRWELIAGNTLNDGRHIWSLPDELSDGYLVRVTDASNTEIKYTTEEPFALSDYVSPDALPNIPEMRQAIFGRISTNQDVMKRGDVDKDGDVDLFDFLNMLDLNSQRLQALSKRPVKKATGDTEVWLNAPTTEGSGDSLIVSLYARSEMMVRGFYLDLKYDSDEIDIDKNLAETNGDGMTLLWDVSKDRIQLLGYLIKQDGAVQLEKALGHIPVYRRKGFEGTPFLEVTAAAFASQSREPIVVGIEATAAAEVLPTDFTLSQNYPNPFNPETGIKFALPIKSKVELRIYNIKGELVRTLVNEERPAGEHSITWDGRNEQDVRVASGIYIYRIKAGTFKSSKRMTMIK